MYPSSSYRSTGKQMTAFSAFALEINKLEIDTMQK
jgi:hypothetical protein